ncbi:MAG: phage tail tip lysozyme [Candidatus Pacearchaeota archaeon]
MGENEEKTREGEKYSLQNDIKNFLEHPVETTRVNINYENKVDLIYEYFKNIKNITLTDEQIAGIIGNLIQESNLDPFLEGDCKNNKCTSIGLAQWHNERKDALLKDCPKTKTPEGQRTNEIEKEVLLCQLNFLVKELLGTEKEAYYHLKYQNNVRDATISFQDKFERCHPDYCSTEKRISYAKAVYDRILRNKKNDIT